MYVSFNGNIIEYHRAKIHVSSATVKYGSSVFEGIRGYWNHERGILYLFALDQHLDRLFDSMKLMAMEHDFSKDRIKQWIRDLLIKNRLTKDCYIRVAASVAGENGTIASTGPVLLSITTEPKGRKAKEDGIKVAVSSWTRVEDTMMPPRIKCIANYQNGRLAMLEALKNGYDNVLLLNSRGKISEAPTCSFFVVKDNVLITPKTTDGILESITRRFVTDLARWLGIEVMERSLDRSEIYLSDEAFLCGTGAEILPIHMIDRYPINQEKTGPLTAKIKHAYFSTVYGRNERFQHMLEPVVREGVNDCENSNV